MSIIGNWGRSASTVSTPPPVPNSAPGAASDKRPFYARIVDEIRSGFKNERRARLDAAGVNADFFHERWDAYTSPWRLDPRAIRCLPIMREAVYHLTAHLYRNSPARSYADSPAVTELLETLYRRNAMDAKWPDADRLSVVNEVAAFEVAGNVGPDSIRNPVKILLWPGDQLIAWLDPDDATKPLAVATRESLDEQQRVRLWTLEGRTTFLTKKWNGSTAGARTFDQVGPMEPNPYRDAEGNPILPFAFVHFNFPSCYFWSGGPGDGLRRANEHINYRLSKLADDIIHWRLIGTVTGARADWNFPRDMKAGEFQSIPSGDIEVSGAMTPAKVEYLAPDLSHVPGDWDDLNRYLELVLQLNHIPPAAFRLEQSATMSGVALVAEQIPLVTWAAGRQRPFAHYERDLATLVLNVTASHMENNQATTVMGATLEEIRALASDGDLSLRWGEMSEELPGQARDQSDQSQFDNYLLSRTQWFMKRKNMTREEAEAAVAEVAADLEREQQLVGPIQQAAMGGGLGAAAVPEETPTDESGTELEPADVEAATTDEAEPEPEPEPDDE